MPHRFLCLVTIFLIWGPQNCFMMEDLLDEPSKFSPLPVLLTLYNTFSSSSPFGLDFSEENSDQENDEKAQVLTVLENWSAALHKDLAKARSFQSPSAKSLYLENHVKYVVLPESGESFEGALENFVWGVVATRHVDTYPHGGKTTRERGTMSPIPDSSGRGGEKE